MISKGLFLFFIVFFLTSGSIQAQRDEYTTTVKYHNGFLLPHHQAIRYVRKSNIEAIEINFGLIPSLNRKWAKLYNQPEIGLAFYHGNLGNNKVWGQTNALFSYINFHLYKKAWFHLISQLGLGASYNNRIFHPTKNYKNTLISSKINAFFSLSFDAEFSISSKFKLITGFGLKHISNGASKHPNSGINLIVNNVGIKYALHSSPIIPYNKIKNYKNLGNEYSITWNHSIKHTKENDLHHYYISNLSANYAIGINAKQRLGFGIDLFYNESANRGQWNKKPKTEFEDRVSQGIHISHHLVISNFTLITQFGVYTLYKTEPEAAIYSRMGLRYNMGRHFYTNFNLKAHGGKAENLECGIGYKFNKKKNKHIASDKTN